MKNRGCLIALLVCILVLIVIVGTIAVIGGAVMLERTGVWRDFGWHMRNVSWTVPSVPGVISGSWPFPLVVGQALSFGRWLFTLAVAVLAYVVIPRNVSRMALEAARDPVRAFGWGLLAVLSAWFAILLLAITVIGIPLAMLLGLALTLVRAIGFAGVGLVVGQRVRVGFGDAGSDRDLLDVVIGVVLLFVVSWVPVLGWLVSFIAGSVAVGTVVITSVGTAGNR